MIVGRPLPVPAWSLACALGRDTAACVDALRAGHSGLVPVGAAHGLSFGSFFGFVPGDLDPLPPALAAWETRHARLIRHGLAPLQPAIDGAVARWGRARVGVVVGTTTGGMAETEARHAAWKAAGRVFADGYDMRRQHAQLATGELVARLAGVAGPRMSQSSACSSSNKVFGSARRLIDADVCDAVIVGGVDSWCRFTVEGFRSLEVLTSDRCAPFAADRSGINLGEAAAFLLVTRDGDAPIRLLGVGETSDAFHMTQPHPEGAGVAASIREALAESGVGPQAIDVVCAHATGTAYNDASEAKAIAATLPHRPPVVGLKGYTGHTLGACGAVEAILLAEAMLAGEGPATCTRTPLDPALDIDVRVAPWTGRLRLGLSTTAAFAGHNAAIVLEAS